MENATVPYSPKPAAPEESKIVWYYENLQSYYDLDGNLTRLEADETVYQYQYDKTGRILSVKSTEKR